MKSQKKGGYLVSKIHQLSQRIFSKMLKQSKLDMINSAQGRIMFPLWRKDGISIVELTKETALAKSTLTSMLDRLEESGYLERVHSKTDRRKILIRLTEDGKKLQEVYSEVSEEMTEVYYEGFDNSEIDAFEGFLERVLENLQKHK